MAVGLISRKDAQSRPETPVVDTPVENRVDIVSNSDPLAFEDFTPGRTFETAKVAVSDEAIRSFASLSGDQNPIHIDDAFATRTVHRGRVAHGLLVTSLASGLAFRAGLFGRNTLALESASARFLAAVRPDQSVYCVLTVTSADASASKRCGRVELAVSVRNESEKEVAACVWTVLFFKRDHLPPAPPKA